MKVKITLAINILALVFVYSETSSQKRSAEIAVSKLQVPRSEWKLKLHVLTDKNKPESEPLPSIVNSKSKSDSGKITDDLTLRDEDQGFDVPTNGCPPGYGRDGNMDCVKEF